MVNFSRKTTLAVEAVLDVAWHSGPAPVQARHVMERLSLPSRYLEQVMQQLANEGILRGVRGPRGGYVLAREREAITVGEIARAVARLEAQEEDEATARSALGAIAFAPIWEEAQKALLDRLDAVTLEDLVIAAKAGGAVMTGAGGCA